jgi:hypothetical protein
MTHNATVPRPREIASSLRSIRAHWNQAKRRERRAAARNKQRQLVQWLSAGHHTLQNAV